MKNITKDLKRSATGTKERATDLSMRETTRITTKSRKNTRKIVSKAVAVVAETSTQTR